MKLKNTLVMLIAGSTLAAGCAQQRASTPAAAVPKLSPSKALITRADGHLVCIKEVERCIVPIYVDEQLDADRNPWCVVYITTGNIIVEPRPDQAPPMKIVWRIHHASGALVKLRDYEFDETAGIRRVDNTEVPGNEEEAAKQFDETVREDKDGEFRHWRFRWRSTHRFTQDARVHYLPLVRRDNVAKPCEAKDPIIKNTG